MGVEKTVVHPVQNKRLIKYFSGQYDSVLLAISTNILANLPANFIINFIFFIFLTFTLLEWIAINSVLFITWLN